MAAVLPTVRGSLRRALFGGPSCCLVRCSRLVPITLTTMTTTASRTRTLGLYTATFNQPSLMRRSFSCNDTKSLQQETILDRVHIQKESCGICRVTLDRPQKLNSLDMDMFKAIAEAGNKLKNDTSVRVIILSGNGRAFCTGLDVPSMVNQSTQEFMTNPFRSNGMLQKLLDRTSQGEPNLVQQVGYVWRQLNVPVICCLHGMCFGGGMQIALGADIRLATPDCKLSIMESKWGLIPDMSASITLRELVRIDVAKELTMTGRVVTGEEAERLGLVTRVVENPLVEAETLALAILERSPDSVALSKQLYQSTWCAVPEEYCLTVETDLQRQLLLTWNQLAAAGRNFGWKIPYFLRKT